MHHGIKNQRWGIRRYQTDDGSLTSAGRSRYMDGDGGFRWGEHDDTGSNKRISADRASSTKTSKKKKMTSEQKKALAKKIAIGVGATALAAAAIYGTRKGMESYANNLLSKVKDKAVTSFADQSVQAHTTTTKRFLRKPKTNIDYDSVRKEVEAYQKHTEQGYKEALAKKKGIATSWQIIKGFHGKPVKVNYASALEMLKRR